jgi:ribonuclease Z
MKLVLLGTGTPIPDPARLGPSQVVEAGDERILVDAGAGVVQRLVQAGYWRAGRPPGQVVTRIVLTHLHSDHVMGLADLLWTGWIMSWWRTPPPIAGPEGTAPLIARMLDTFAEDIAIRTSGEGLSREALVPAVEEIDEGWSVSGPDARVSAFRVDHAPVDQAFGVRVDGPGGAIVVSGDTRVSRNLIKWAQGCDILVHEVYWRRGAAALRATITDPAALRRRDVIDGYHTHSEEVGAAAAAADAKHLVLSHILFRGGAPSDLEEDIRPTFRGDITVGADLQVFEV